MDEVDNNLNCSGGKTMEEEPVIECKQQLNNERSMKKRGEQQLATSTEEINKEKDSEQRLAEKRARQDDEEIIEEDGFVTVIRGHKKANRQSSNSDKINENSFKAGRPDVIVSVTGKEILPKQFGMAKLLRSLSIENITRIVYKNAFKALIHFNNREDASKLLSCVQLTDLGYRLQMTDEANLCYGILKQVDLEMEEKEILDNVSCEYDVISVKRLRRQSHNGEWIDSETIRICFKGNILPPYVQGYGCRFKVEPYTFPVSQCSVCWRFGHLSRSCPMKKQICPKCGNDHPNCETKNFVCVNCKGSHMALDKNCPVFLKEKKIRNIMTENSCNYRKGLEIYLKQQETQKSNDITHHNHIEANTQQSVINSEDESPQDNYETSYRNILITDAIVHNEQDANQMEVDPKQNVDQAVVCQQNFNQKKRVVQNKQQKGITQEINTTTQHSRQQSKNTEKRHNNWLQTKNFEKDNTPDSEKSKKTFSVYSTFKKIQEICLSDADWSSKFKQLAKFLMDICGQWLLKFLSVDDLWKNVVSIFNDG